MAIPTASPLAAGTSLASTPAAADNSTKVATTNYADRAIVNHLATGNFWTAPQQFSVGATFGTAVSAAAAVSTFYQGSNGTAGNTTSFRADYNNLYLSNAYGNVVVEFASTEAHALGIQEPNSPYASTHWWYDGAGSTGTGAWLSSPLHLNLRLGDTAGTYSLKVLNSSGTLVAAINSVGNATLSSTGTATSSAAFNSPTLTLTGAYWTGSASAADSWGFVDTIATGTNPATTLTISHTGSSGTATVSVPNLSTAGAITATGTVTGGNVTTAGLVTANQTKTAVMNAGVWATIASAATVAPNTPFVNFTGTTGINTITVPSGAVTTYGGSFQFVTSGAIAFGTSGNIGSPTFTSVTNTLYSAVWSPTLAKWYIK